MPTASIPSGASFKESSLSADYAVRPILDMDGPADS